MKISIVVLFTSLLVLIHPANSAARTRITRLHRSQSLHVNTGPRHYQINKSRRAGESELFHLCRVADREENFIYVKYKSGREEWYECGTNETPRTAAVDMSVMRQIRKKRRYIRKLSFYHHHPVEREGDHDNSQTPSEKDVQGFVKIARVIGKRDPGLLKKLDFRVVTTSGVHIFRLNRKIVKNRRMRNKVINTAARIDEHRSKNRVYWYSNQANFAKENIKFARKFSSRLMKLRFMPAPENRQLAKIRQSQARKLSFNLRDIDQNVYDVYHNRDLNLIILKNPAKPVLYDEKGNRIGYVGSTGDFLFATPPGGWPAKHKAEIKLEVYQEVKEKMLAIKALGRKQ